jgi:hypothetical protein
MKKQANFGSIIESFKKQLKVASCEQGRQEEPVALGKSDSEVVAELPTPAETNQKLLERGVESGESLPDAPKNLPEEGLERKECSPESKIASPIDDLVSRLKANLKVAAEQAFTTKEPEAKEPKKDPSEQKQEKVEVPSTEEAGDSGKEHEEKLDKGATDNSIVSVAEPVTETGEAEPAGGTPEAAEHIPVKDSVVSVAEPVTETGKTAAEVNVDELAQKTAEFLRYSELGYEMAKAMFDTLPEQKTASEQSIDEQAIEQAVAERVENLKQAGYNDDQILAQLELDGRADAAALAGPSIEDLVNQKVAALQELGVSEEEIMKVLQKDAEADSEALAQQLHAVISELEQAVQAGQLTEEQALQLLEESGLNIQGLLATAQQGGEAPVDPAAAGAAPAPEAVAADVPAAVVEEAAQEGEPVAEEASEKKEPAKEKAEDEKDHGSEDKKEDKSEEKKEAELTAAQEKIDVNHNDKIDGEDLKSLRDNKTEATEAKEEPEAAKKEAAPADASAAGSPVAASGMDQLPPEVQQLIQQLDQLLQSGAISEEQAMAILDALFQGQAGGQPEAAPEGAPGAAPTPAATATPQVVA